MSFEQEKRKFNHELQSPLAVIQGFLRLIEPDFQNHPDQNKNLLFEAAQKSLEKIKTILNKNWPEN